MTDPKVEEGLVVGNTYDKYGTSNPIARLLLRNFFRSFEELVQVANPVTVLEAGCGEGELSIRLARQGRQVLATDISAMMVREARKRARARGVPLQVERLDLFEVDPAAGTFDLVVCCEVLEHLEEPERAIRHLARLSRGHVLVSVPREPIWRVLNMARGHYLKSLGNTPGHIQHWSRRSFNALLSEGLEVVAERRPLPWLMALGRPDRQTR